ncbi:hypothetical protein [Streptomyces sp. NPDC048445]|uniref:hypothetical protein n=1 Tax=Streptomyces sp. NPDC048445 TaxID=3365553 RepID=UPI00370FFADF
MYRPARKVWTAPVPVRSHVRLLGEDRPSPRATPPDFDTLAARLTEMRQTAVPARAQQKDAGDQRRVAHVHGQAATAKENALMYRSVADNARAEKQLRERIAQQHPGLHRAEIRARAELQQAQTARIEQHTRRYEPSAPSRSGPSRGR